MFFNKRIYICRKSCFVLTLLKCCSFSSCILGRGIGKAVRRDLKLQRFECWYVNVLRLGISCDSVEKTIYLRRFSISAKNT